MELEIYVIEKLKSQRQQEIEINLGTTRSLGGGGIRRIFGKFFIKTKTGSLQGKNEGEATTWK